MTRLGRILLALWLANAASGCLHSKSFRAGRAAERGGRYDEAVNYYTRALAEDPDNLNYRQSLERAKLRAAAFHAGRASRLFSAGAVEAALGEMRVAFALNPSDTHLGSELARIEAALKEKGAAGARTSVEALKEQAQERPLGRLELSPGSDQPARYLFREASLRDVLAALGKVAGVNVLFDSGFHDRPISLELRETTFEEALRSVCAATQNFYRIQSGKIVTIVPDTPAKRREYEQQLMKTFYLSNADLKETIDLLRIVLGARRIAPLTSTNAFTLIDTPEKVAAAERIIATLDKARAELVVEMELLEVNRSKVEEYGIQLRSQESEGVATGLVPRDLTLDQPLYGKSNLLVANLPGALLQLLRSDSDSRLLANPQLRSLDGQTAQVQFGERVPIPITTFTPLATGGLAQQPVTSFEYQNVGVNLEVTPRLHHNDEVSLALKVQVDNIAGTGFSGLPTFGNRSVNTVLRLRDGETNLLAGLIRDEERTTLTGLPGLANLPVVGRIFSSNKKTVQETDIILTLTPRIVRRAEISVEDLRSYLIEGGLAGGFLYEAPLPLPPREPEREREAKER